MVFLRWRTWSLHRLLVVLDAGGPCLTGPNCRRGISQFYVLALKHTVNDLLVAKEYKPNFETKFGKSYSKIEHDEKIQLVIQDAVSQRTATRLASAFSAKLSEHKLSYTVEYLLPRVLEMRDRIFSVEPLLKHKGLNRALI